MADVLRIEIPIEVSDRTEPALSRATQNVTAFEQTFRRTHDRLRRMSATEFQMRMTAIERVTPVLRTVEARLGALTRRTWEIGLRIAGSPLRLLDAVWNRLTSIQTIIAAIAASQAARYGILEPLRLESEMQRVQIGFETYLGPQRARAFVQELQRFERDTTYEWRPLAEFAMELLPVLDGNTKLVMRTLKAFGDAAALTGASMENLGLALYGFRQIASTGRLGMEELKQVTENLLIPMKPILEELGVRQEDMKELGKLNIPAARAMEAILRALERPVEKGGFLGGMQRQMETLENQASKLRGLLLTGLVMPWGRGLASVVTPALQRINDWFDRNQETVGRWSRALEDAARRAAGRVVGWFEGAGRRLQDLLNDPRWRQADFFGKVKLAWDELIVQPFNDWWNSRGQEQFTRIGEQIFGFLGRAANSAILGALGLLDGSGQGGQRSPFDDAGTTAGKRFWNAFMAEIDTEQIKQRLENAARIMLRETLKLAPGGAPPTPLSWGGAAAMGWFLSNVVIPSGMALYGGYQALRGIVRGGRRAIHWARERFGGRRPRPPAGGMPHYGPTGEIITPGAGQRATQPSRWALIWERFRGWGSRLPVPQGVRRVFSGIAERLPGPLGIAADAMHIFSSQGQQRWRAVGEVVGGAIGAAIGSIIPGPGTVIGGFLGSILGSMGGSRIAGALMSRLGGGALGGIARLFAALPQRLGGVLAQVQARISAIMPAIAGWFRQLPAAASRAFAALPGMVQRFVGRIPYFLGFALGTAVRMFASLPGRVGSFLAALPGRVSAVFASVRVTMGSMASAAVGAAVRFFASLPGRVSAFLAGVPGRVLAAGSSWAAAARSAASQLVSGALSAITSLPGRVAGVMERIISRVRSYGSTLFQVAKRAFEQFVAGYRAGMDEHSPGYIERSMYRIMDVSRATAFAVGSDMQRLAASMGPRMRALHDGIMAAGGLGYGSTVQPPAIRPAVAAPVQDAPAAPVRTTTTAGPVSITVHIGSVSFTTQVDGGDPEHVLRTIRANARQVAREIADDVAFEIGRLLVPRFNNMPRTALA